MKTHHRCYLAKSETPFKRQTAKVLHTGIAKVNGNPYGPPCRPP